MSPLLPGPCLLHHRHTQTNKKKKPQPEVNEYLTFSPYKATQLQCTINSQGVVLWKDSNKHHSINVQGPTNTFFFAIQFSIVFLFESLILPVNNGK